MKNKIKRIAIRLLAFLLYTREQWRHFLACAEAVSADVGIPVYGADQNRYGREARRDAAVHCAQKLMSELKDAEVNLGCELAHWWRKLVNR